MWTFITPQLPVRDVVAAQQYYRDVLGFHVGWTSPDGSFGAVYLGTTELFLARSDSIAPATCCVRVEDVDAVYAAYQASGAKIVDELEVKPWSMREFSVEDDSGHRFRIGQSTLGPPVVTEDGGGRVWRERGR
jgi:uncharacterized glyoxalase superfamily protein PhnB